MNVFVILGVLFLALIIIIPLIEKSNMRVSAETTNKMSKLIIPLIAIMLGIGLFKAIF